MDRQRSADLDELADSIGLPRERIHEAYLRLDERMRAAGSDGDPYARLLDLARPLAPPCAGAPDPGLAE